jgi:hypothetical protein
MPGTFTIDTAATFTLAILLASGPKTEFQSTAQAVSANGERKWDLSVALTWRAEGDRKPVSEVVSITITGPAADPAADLTPGTPVELTGLRVGISSPEKTERGIRGGRAWYQADGVRAVAIGAQGRPHVVKDAS